LAFFPIRKKRFNLSDYDSEEADNFLEDGRVAPAPKIEYGIIKISRILWLKDVQLFFFIARFIIMSKTKNKEFFFKKYFYSRRSFNGIHKWYIKIRLENKIGGLNSFVYKIN
jgi:hypothetical protein